MADTVASVRKDGLNECDKRAAPADTVRDTKRSKDIESTTKIVIGASDTSTSSKDVDLVTMVDIHAEQQELEDHATAVLGACDENKCTYSKGYMKRQALYACNTCSPKEDRYRSAGICLACSYHCHEGHDLFELYTKRDFRCDCGNGKFFGNIVCELAPGKDKFNKRNKYNHNFRGLYCTCEKPYPDPEVEEDEKMLQCIVCEDWYHEGHLGKPLPSDAEDFEVICAECMKKCNFLAHYVNADYHKLERAKQCPLKGKEDPTDFGTAYFPDGWRKSLCRCIACKDRYESQSVAFLLDEEDTLQAHEERGRAKLETPQEQERRILSVMDRYQQVECLQGYNDMKKELMDYLKKFVENGKVVREEDIKEFFSGMEARKKQRLTVNIPYRCH